MPTRDDHDGGDIAQLLRDGRHREAGELLLERGDDEGAMEAFAAIWDYRRAAEVARGAGHRTAALDYLLRLGDRAAVGEVLEEFANSSADESEALELLLARGEKECAARLLEARGEHARAAALVRTTGDLHQAARLYERAGAYREAGRTYERILETNPSDGEAALKLGGILSRYGKQEQAAQMYQTAAKDSDVTRPALRGLVCALHSLGLRDAAQSTLKDLLELDGSVLPTLEAFVAAESSQRRRRADEVDDRWFHRRYHVRQLIGGGAVSSVYMARDALFDRTVALKVLSSGTGSRASRDAFRRFVREAQVAARLDHPNIVKVLDFQQDAGVLVMEYLDGGTLADRLGQGPLSLPTLKQLLRALLAALETAHIRGVVHRDVKPQNVLFTRGGGIKLGDFGVAHLKDLGLTQTGTFIGTLTYMAPEQITGGKVSAATDLYALGVTLYHALCGQPPFRGPDLVAQHMAVTPEPPGVLRPDVGPRFDAFLGRLLAKVPTDRFDNAAQVREAADGLDFTDPGPPSVPPEPPTALTAGPVRTPTIPSPAPPQGQPQQNWQERLELEVVVLESVDNQTLDHYTNLAPVMSPFLQCVLSADRMDRRVVLEQPRPSKETKAFLQDETLVLTSISQVASALTTLLSSGHAHGSVKESTVIRATHRTVLLLPLPDEKNATPATDAQDLVKLWCTWTGFEGEPADFFEPSGPLPSLLGDDGLALAAPLKESPTVAIVGQIAKKALRALTYRRHEERHLLALAAGARAQGADPREGKLSDFFRHRGVIGEPRLP